MRFVKIFLIVLPILAIPIYYLGLRTGYYSIPTILVMLTLAFPFFRGHKLANLSFISMSVLSFIFVAFIMRDLLSLGGINIPINITAGIAVTLTIAGFWWGQKPRLKKIIIPIKELPEKLIGLTIIQISDLHLGKNIGEAYVKHIVDDIDELKPDLLVFTGDIGDSDPTLHGKDLDGLKNVQTKLGTYYVPGNHEYYWNIHSWLDVMRNLGMEVLLNQGKVIEYNQESFLIAGITDPMDRKNPPNLNKALDGHQYLPFKILLSHRPDPGKVAGKLGFNLMLAGHTHGGQFFPWTLAARLVHKFHAGLFHHKGLSIYVSGGTGSWGPLLRLGTTAEITHITLKRT